MYVKDFNRKNISNFSVEENEVDKSVLNRYASLLVVSFILSLDFEQPLMVDKSKRLWKINIKQDKNIGFERNIN